MATQYGTIKLQTAGGIVDVPVWAVGDVNYPIWRVQTPSGVGAVHLETPADADYPYLRVQTQNNGVLAVSNSIMEMVDSFEDGNISEYGGNTAQLNLTTAKSVDGSYSLVHNGGSWGGISSTTGLARYPQPGDTIHYNYQIGGNVGAMLMFATQAETGNPDGYRVGNNPNNGKLFIELRNGGTNTNLASSATSLNINEWHEIVTDWGTDGTIAATWYDSTGTKIASISATDTTFTSGGVGFRGGYTNKHWHDYVWVE